MTVKKSADMPISPSNPDDLDRQKYVIDATIRVIKRLQEGISEEVITSEPKLPKLTDMTVDDLKILISEVVAAELQKWSNQSTTKDLDNSSNQRPYLNSEGQYIFIERTPEEIARQVQDIRNLFAEWEREEDATEQRETLEFLQQALGEDLLSEHPLPISK